jgi:hypothetical protein
MSIDELIASKSSWDADSAVLSINEKTGKVEKMSISTYNPDEAVPGAAKINIKVEVSWPPFKVKITVTF